MPSFLDVFRSEVGKLRAKLRESRQALEKARRRREDLQTLPLPAPEIVDLIFAVIAARGAQFPGRVRSRLAPFITKPPTAGDLAQLQSTPMLALAEHAHQPTAADIEPGLIFIFGDQIKDGLRRAVNAAMEGRRAGPPRAQRERELAELETSIAALEGEEREMLALLQEARCESTQD